MKQVYFLSIYVPRNICIFLSIKFRSSLKKISCESNFCQKGKNNNTLLQKLIMAMIFTKILLFVNHQV